MDEMEGIIEGMLFMHGDPLPLSKICDALQLDAPTTEKIIRKMQDGYVDKKRGLMIRRMQDSYQLCTKREYFEYIQRIYVTHSSQALSNAAYETLAIIAYNEPVTKAFIENIRGVSCDSSISKLLDRNLIKDAGRKDAPGRPVLYQTTEEFLRCFGLSSVKELPPVDTLIQSNSQS